VSCLSHYISIYIYINIHSHRADTLYLCYCIDKAEGMKRREEVFIAFEYDFGRQQQQQQQRQQVQPILPVTAGARRQAAQAQTQRRNETLFDVDAANIEAGSAGAGTKKKGTLPLPVLQGTQGRKGRRTMPLLNSPFLEEEEGFGGAGATPTPRRAGAGAGVDNKGQVGAAGAKLKPQVQEEDLEEDLDPFRRSLVDDEEAQVRTVVRVKTGPPGAGRADTPTGGGGMRMPTSAGGFGTIAKPSLVNFGASPGVVGGGGLGFGHRKTGSSGGAGGGATISVGGIQLQQKQQQQQQRMLTSTQELNMKSQFLMNMRAYGEESESVLEEQDSKLEEMEVEMGGSGTQRSAVMSLGLGKEKEDEDSLSEGEESQLGPGSDFFK